MRPRQLRDFSGEWCFERVIDEAGGRRIEVSGRAIWTPREGGLDYEEIGQMQWPGQPPLHVERRYFWDLDLGVFFADGREFHKVPPEGGETAHWCDPDQYDGHYDFDIWPTFKVTWRVKGPRKDYCMQTIYWPLGQTRRSGSADEQGCGFA